MSSNIIECRILDASDGHLCALPLNITGEQIAGTVSPSKHAMSMTGRFVSSCVIPCIPETEPDQNPETKPQLLPNSSQLAESDWVSQAEVDRAHHEHTRLQVSC